MARTYYSEWTNALARGDVTYQDYLAAWNAGAVEPPPDVQGLRRKQEEREGGFADAFGQFLQKMPSYNRLSGLGQQALEDQYEPLYATYKWGGAAFTPDAEGYTTPFASFLENNGALSPNAMNQLLIGRAQQHQAGSSNPMLETERGSLGDNPTAMEAFLQPALQGIAPMFRGAARKSAQGITDRWTAANLGRSLLDYLGSQRGFKGIWGM